MYTPAMNLITDKQEAISFMQRYSFATIVTVNNQVPVATHLPFVVTLKDDNVILTSHFAKANPQWQDLINNRSLVIFAEPHAYISPKHYDQINSVSTWNYLAVYAYGKAKLIESAEEKAILLEQTIHFYEAAYMQQWASLPDDFKLKMMNGIVGFEIEVDELQGKKKLSQNKTEQERERIIDELSASNDSVQTGVAEYMKTLK